MIELDPKIIKDMFDKYGEDEQIRAAMGECGEFIASAQNYHRCLKYGVKTEPLANLIEEAVDVYFMMQQMRSLDSKMFDDLCLEKVDKVMQRLHEGDGYEN